MMITIKKKGREKISIECYLEYLAGARSGKHSVVFAIWKHE